MSDDPDIETLKQQLEEARADGRFQAMRLATRRAERAESYIQELEFQLHNHQLLQGRQIQRYESYIEALGGIPMEELEKRTVAEIRQLRATEKEQEQEKVRSWAHHIRKLQAESKWANEKYQEKCTELKSKEDDMALKEKEWGESGVKAAKEKETLQSELAFLKKLLVSKATELEAIKNGPAQGQSPSGRQKTQPFLPVPPLVLPPDAPRFNSASSSRNAAPMGAYNNENPAKPMNQQFGHDVHASRKWTRPQDVLNRYGGQVSKPAQRPQTPPKLNSESLLQTKAHQSQQHPLSSSMLVTPATIGPVPRPQQSQLVTQPHLLPSPLARDPSARTMPAILPKTTAHPNFYAQHPLQPSALPRGISAKPEHNPAHNPAQNSAQQQPYQRDHPRVQQSYSQPVASQPGPIPLGSSENLDMPRVVACVNCHRNWWHDDCDNGDDKTENCTNCKAMSVYCERPKCNNFATGTCPKKDECKRAHEDDDYDNLAEYKKEMKRKMTKALSEDSPIVKRQKAVAANVARRQSVHASDTNAAVVTSVEESGTGGTSAAKQHDLMDMMDRVMNPQVGSVQTQGPVAPGSVHDGGTATQKTAHEVDEMLEPTAGENRTEEADVKQDNDEDMDREKVEEKEIHDLTGDVDIANIDAL